jgi:glutathione S-transferase
MITVFGEGRGFRIVWLLEEMGLPCKLRPVDLLAGVENDTEFLAINPAGFIPALQDGDVTRPNRSETTGPPARRWACSKVGWGW